MYKLVTPVLSAASNIVIYGFWAVKEKIVTTTSEYKKNNSFTGQITHISVMYT